MTSGARNVTIRICGLLILLLGGAAALLPLAQHIPGRTVVGLMLIAAGALELFAAWARRGRHISASVAAAASLLAGLRLAVDPTVNFFTVLNFVILWLVVRAAALFFSARGAGSPVCWWIYFAAAVDFLLAVLLLMGLPVAVLVYGIFGQTNQIVASFAWIFALSFVAAGLLLMIAGPQEARNTR